MKKLILIIFLLVGTSLYAAANRYSVVTLENYTPHTIHYIYGWGPGDERNTTRNTIEPYGEYFHWWEFAYPGEDWAPWLWIRIEGQRDWYQLESYFSPNTNYENAAHYYFVEWEYEDGTYGEMELVDDWDVEYYYWW